MAYTHVLYEVNMEPASVSTANTPLGATLGQRQPYTIHFPLNVTYNPTVVGAGIYAPLTVPHKIHRIGVQTVANAANPFDLVFWKRQEGGATAWPTGQAGGCTGEYFRVMVPTIGATGKSIFKNPTANYIVYPGEQLSVGVSTILVSLHARVAFLVSPVWEELGNVTQASRTTAP